MRLPRAFSLNQYENTRSLRNRLLLQRDGGVATGKAHVSERSNVVNSFEASTRIDVVCWRFNGSALCRAPWRPALRRRYE